MEPIELAALFKERKESCYNNYVALPKTDESGTQVIWQVGLPYSIEDSEEKKARNLMMILQLVGNDKVAPIALSFVDRQAAEDLVASLNSGRSQRYLSSP